MSNFATPSDEFPLLEDEFVPILDDGDIMFAGSVESLGLSLVPKDLTFTIVIFALAAGVDAASWWSR